MSAERPDPIAAARRRNERVIAYAVLTIAGFGILIAGWRTLTVEATQGIRILAFALIIAGLYSTMLFRGPSRGTAWLRSTVEVSTACVVMLLDAQAGADFIVTSSTSYVFLLAIATTTLRLDVRLSIYATVLAIVEHTAVYLWALQQPDLFQAGPAHSLARLYQELFFRIVVIAVMGALGAILARTLRKEIALAAEEDRVRTAFGHYVDRRVVNAVLAGNLRIAPERRAVTVMFVDIRNFTHYAESHDASEVFRTLSATLDLFAQEVQKQGGIVNKYLGDGLFAFFGAPEEQPDQQRRAVRAGLRIVSEAAACSKDGRFPGLRVGVGIHSGDAVVGDLGGERREFTAIGDVVNVASRVEAANKDLGTSLLVTKPVYDALRGDATARAHSAITVRGRDASVDVYEVLALEKAEISSTGLRRAPAMA